MSAGQNSVGRSGFRSNSWEDERAILESGVEATSAPLLVDLAGVCSMALLQNLGNVLCRAERGNLVERGKNVFLLSIPVAVKLFESHLSKNTWKTR